MNKLADLIEANKEILAAVDSWDNGILIPIILRQTHLTPSPPQANPTP